MKPNCKQFWSDRTFLIFSQQCKAKQLKSYKVIIDNSLKCSEKNQDLTNNEADLQGIKLKGPGHFTLKNNFEPMFLFRVMPGFILSTD